jgi:hypothetical protein
MCAGTAASNNSRPRERAPTPCSSSPVEERVVGSGLITYVAGCRRCMRDGFRA